MTRIYLPGPIEETVSTNNNPWRVVTWSDENYRVIRKLACHTSELTQVLALPFPDGAVCRDAVAEMTSDFEAEFFHRQSYPAKVGDSFTDHVNQGDRDCVVIAYDDATGDYLYEYAMPNGRTYLRNSHGKSVSRRHMPHKWRVMLHKTDNN